MTGRMGIDFGDAARGSEAPRDGGRAPGRIEPPSVKSLLIQMTFEGRVLSTATGFVVRSARGPMLLTNRHNVTGRRQDTNELLADTGAVPDAITIVHNRAGRLGEWLGKTEPLYAAEQPRWHEHPRLGAQADFVALPLSDVEDVAFYPYLDGSDATIRCGPSEPMSVVGFPFGLQAGGSFAVWATGFVASEPDIDFRGLPLFLIDCRTRPGQSGSAVVAHRAGGMVALDDGSSAMYNGPVTRFLGIYSGRINSESDIGMVWKAAAIQELISGLR